MSDDAMRCCCVDRMKIVKLEMMMKRWLMLLRRLRLGVQTKTRLMVLQTVMMMSLKRQNRWYIFVFAYAFYSPNSTILTSPWHPGKLWGSRCNGIWAKGDVMGKSAKSATNPWWRRDVPFSPNSIKPTSPKLPHPSRVCRGLHGVVGLVEFGLMLHQGVYNSWKSWKSTGIL